MIIHLMCRSDTAAEDKLSLRVTDDDGEPILLQMRVSEAADGQKRLVVTDDAGKLLPAFVPKLAQMIDGKRDKYLTIQADLQAVEWKPELAPVVETEEPEA